MTESKFLDLLAQGKPLLADGAMGTMLHNRGVSFEACFDQLNLTNPELVAEIHRDYIAAVNIYRVYQEQRKKRFSVKNAKPVP